jgi:malate dehydrogenase (oxaloacetate-decarboxylating)
MIMASAKALAALSPVQKDRNAALLPPIAESCDVSLAVAEAVGKQAIAEGLAEVSSEDVFMKELTDYVWSPVYVPYQLIGD